jgi:FKBP-type peptidyl-prolyl cis-trans isomerase
MKIRHCLLLTLLAVSCKNSSAPSETAPPPPPPPASSAPPAASVQHSADLVQGATAATPAAPSQAAPTDVPVPGDLEKPPASAKKTASGLVTNVLQPGTGKEHPGPNDQVVVNYSGWTKDGKMFDSSVPRRSPSKFGVSQVIKGWTEGLQLMVTGERRRMWIPSKLAYGEHPMPGAPVGDLVFDVELLELTKAPAPPPVPTDVKAAPKTAKKTPSGLAYRVLQKGTGKDHPAATSRVTVHYSGWTTDGKMFDSSVTRGQPATFSLNQVVKGWTEGVQLMVVGEKTRFWLPPDLGYGDKPRPGAPSGMLVFDIELLNIQ